MTEILTESFCERCGTRYTFESARPRTRLKGVKVLSRGLKNFVLSDDTSIDEAMAAARSEADRETSSHQLDAFHKTFNFCMSCRQYTCPNCWNEAEARCLSCAPLAIPEISEHIHDLPGLTDAVLAGEAAPSNGAPAIEMAAEAWPVVDEPERVDAAQAEVSPGIAEPEPEIAEHWALAPSAERSVDELVEPPAAVIEDTIDAPQQPVAAADEIAADGIAHDPASDATTETGDAGDKAASQTLGLLQRFRPGQSLDAALDAFERERDASEPAEPVTQADAPTDDLGALQAERLAAASASVEQVSALASDVPPAAGDRLEPPTDVADDHPFRAPDVADDGADQAFEPVVAAEPVAAQRRELESIEVPDEPVAEPAAAAAADVVEQPTWRITAPDPTSAQPAVPGIDPGAPPQPSAPARPAGDPQWPTRPEWRSASAAAGLPFLGRPATPQGGIDALWAASNQELVTAPPAPGKVASGIQPCISCGLSLSATARFCRRCGTLQTR